MGSPARRLINPVTRCWDQPHYRYAGMTTDEAPDQPLTQTPYAHEHAFDQGRRRAASSGEFTDHTQC